LPYWRFLAIRRAGAVRGIGSEWNDADIESLKQRIQSDFTLWTFPPEDGRGGFDQCRGSDEAIGICRDRAGHARGFRLTEQNGDQR
jgi:hypothetical protein